MTTHDERRASPDPQRVRDALRALPAPPADAAFRERLAREFAAGTIRPRLRVVPRAWYRRADIWAGGAALAAAAAAVVVLLNPAPAWRVVQSHGSGAVAIAGTPAPVPLADRAALDRALVRDVRLSVPVSGELTLASSGVLALRLTPGTEAFLTTPPGRWFAREREITVEEGELFVTTQPGFRGASLAVKTREATVRVSGTTFAVLAHAEGTCVCVMDGVVQVTPVGGAAEVVPPGSRCFVYRDGRPLERAPILETSREILGDLDRVIGGHRHHPPDR